MTKIVVADREFDIGKATPEQLAGIARLLGKLNVEGRKQIANAGKSMAKDPSAIIWAILSVLSADDLIELAALSIGSDKEFAKENFDLVWVTDALATLVEETDLEAIVKNFTRLASRGLQ